MGDMKGEMLELMFVYQDIQDKLFDIDRTWQNSLVFYGLKQESGCVYESADCTESKVSQTPYFLRADWTECCCRCGSCCDPSSTCGGRSSSAACSGSTTARTSGPATDRSSRPSR